MGEDEGLTTPSPQLVLFAHGGFVTICVGLPVIGLLCLYAGWSTFAGIALLALLIPLQVRPQTSFRL